MQNEFGAHAHMICDIHDTRNMHISIEHILKHASGTCATAAASRIALPAHQRALCILGAVRGTWDLDLGLGA